MDNIKERIKQIRKYNKLSQENFGKNLGVSRDVISNIEQGRVEPKDLIIEHICNIYSINKDWLLYGTGQMLKETVSNMIETLAKEYNLSADEILIIKNYVQMPEPDRKKFADFLKALTTIPSAKIVPQNKPDNKMTTEEKRKIVNAELDAEAKAKIS